MKNSSVLIMRPEDNSASPADQAVAMRLSAGREVQVEEQHFRPDVPGDLEAKALAWQGKIAGIAGAMRVPDARRLGQVAERMNSLCFVANNNPTVWQKRRHIFHIGFPTAQTTAAVAAALVQNTKRRRYLLLHDTSEFQARVAEGMQSNLLAHGMQVRSRAWTAAESLDAELEWEPELIQLVLSSERKALQAMQALPARMRGVPLLLGRSLLRESFLKSLNGQDGEFWFIDTNFRRAGGQTEAQRHFLRDMEEHGVAVPTTNHAFGWDCMKFCAAALKAGDGDPLRAIAYLESGVALEGATGTCSFSRDNHNGRHGHGPTILSRWRNGQFEAV